MRLKRTSGALMTSVALHLVIAIVTGIYLITQTPRFQEFIGVEMLHLKVPPGPKVRKPIIKSTISVMTKYSRYPKGTLGDASSVKEKTFAACSVSHASGTVSPTGGRWADASSLNALTKWLNERTKIKADMSVEGGAVKLTDANLLKSPLVFMTGHDPSLVRARNLFGKQYGGHRIDSRFSEAEAAGLRRYLVEKGGFLVFDDCGVNAPMQAMVRLFLAQMRYVMPEYQVERISNNHEVYNNFYEIGGPPVGFDIFWWGTRPPKRNYLP